MIENTVENKLKFFALYFGQEILKYHFIANTSPHADPVKINHVTLMPHLTFEHEAYIELRSVKRLTVEEISKLPSWKQDQGHDIKYVINYYNSNPDVGLYRFIKSLTPEDHVYLREIGIFLEWNGLTESLFTKFGWGYIK